MTETPDAHRQGPATEERPAARATGGAGTSRGRAALLSLLVLVLLVLGVTAGGGYWLWQQLQVSRAAAERLEARWDARIRALEESLAEARARERERMQTRIETLRRELASVSESLGALEAWAHAGGAGGVEPQIWSIAQAKILLLTAAYHSAAHRRAEAVRALESASARLAAVRDARLEAVRERLAADVKALRGSSDAELAHIETALSELAHEARQLPLPPIASPQRAARGAPPAGGGETAANGWRGVLDAVWGNVTSLVVVRRVGEEGSGEWLPEQRRLRRARVHRALDGARLAALRRDTEAFNAGLRAAREWLEARTDAGTPRIQGMVERIETLQSAVLAENQADPLTTLRLLERTLASPVPAEAVTGR